MLSSVVMDYKSKPKTLDFLRSLADLCMKRFYSECLLVKLLKDMFETYLNIHKGPYGYGMLFNPGCGVGLWIFVFPLSSSEPFVFGLAAKVARRSAG